MLHALRDHGRGLGGEPGFRVREIRWCIDVSADGRFLGVIPLGDGKRGQSTERCPDMHAMNSGGKAHFLVESAQSVALLCKGDEDEAKLQGMRQRNAFYRQMLADAAREVPILAPVSATLAGENELSRIRDALFAAKAKPPDWLTWRVNGLDPVVSEAVQLWWRNWRAKDLSGAGVTDKSGKKTGPTPSMVCMLSGEATAPLATHPPINGLGAVGGLAMGDRLISFDKTKRAFSSYGLEQAANAAMNDVQAQQYIDGLNDLVRNHSRRIANALVAHWFKDKLPPADDPFALLYGLEADESTVVSAQALARHLLDAIRSGQRADLSGNRFYAITLSGASGRVMVRDWMEGSFEQLVKNVEAWFSDLCIVARDGTTNARDPKFRAVCGALVLELKNLPGSIASSLWRCAAFGQPIPAALMAQALARFRSALLKDEPFNHARMGLIKAFFVRRLNRGDIHMKPAVNSEHPSPAYHCGRLLAVLAGLQRAALGDVGAGVVQRFYAATSQTPGLIIGRLVSNARNHLGKLDGGLAWWYEERIAEIMARLGDGAPRTLNLEGQGLFALGYYQQIAALRAGNKDGTPDAANDQQEGSTK
jgi:CRISPR-associated protein Csd1